MSSVDGIGAVQASKVVVVEAKKHGDYGAAALEAKPDEVMITSKQAPKIGIFRLATGFLTDEQIKQINETGRLPKNAKFVKDPFTGGYRIENNFFGITPGTRQIPAGFEVKKGGIFGQVIVVPQGTEGLLIRDAA